MNEFNTEIMVQCPFCGYAMLIPQGRSLFLQCTHCNFVSPRSEDGTLQGSYAAFDKLIDRIRNYNPANYPTPTSEEKMFFWLRNGQSDSDVADNYLAFQNGFMFKDEAIDEARENMNEGDSFRILELTESEFNRLGRMAVLP